MASEGLIRGEEELKVRKRRIRLAINREQLDAALDGLEAERAKLARGDLRASDADREDATRRLSIYEAQGYIGEAEAQKRTELVLASTTPNEILKVFVDLPKLDARPENRQRLISTEDRDEAIDLVDSALINGRISPEQHRAAKTQVRSARDRRELDAAVYGLADRRAAAMAVATTAATKAKRGARLAAIGALIVVVTLLGLLAITSVIVAVIFGAKYGAIVFFGAIALSAIAAKLIF